MCVPPNEANAALYGSIGDCRAVTAGDRKSHKYRNTVYQRHRADTGSKERRITRPLIRERERERGDGGRDAVKRYFWEEQNSRGIVVALHHITQTSLLLLQSHSLYDW